MWVQREQIRVLVGSPEGRSHWEDQGIGTRVTLRYIKMDLREIRINGAQGRV
jgi:hypothetical protein